MLSLILSSRFSPILKPLTPELNLMPSSYLPGAASESLALAKLYGLAGDEPKLMLADFVFV